MNNRAIIQTQSLSIGYRRRKQMVYPVQTDLNLSVYQGQLVCLIGPNGCGKSTLLRTLGGLQALLEGDILIDGLSLSHQSLRNKARLIAFVLTDRIEVSNLTVFNLVAMGRNPYTDWLGHLREEDKEKVHIALEQVHLDGYEQRFVTELSDGERQRAMIAKALVQDTPVILLDEPTSHLDLPNRVEVMLLLKRLAKETNKAIILSIHELDLALQAADMIWLMSPRQGVVVGPPGELIQNNSIQTVFASDAFYFDERGGFVIK